MNQRKLQSETPQIDFRNEYLKLLFANLNFFVSNSLSSYRFIVTAINSNGHIPGGSVITFDEKVIDHSNSFIIEEGKFIVPSSGNYLFFFNSDAVNTGGSVVEVCLNGVTDYYFYETNGDSSTRAHQHNFMFTSKLVKGDELWLYNVYFNTLVNYAYYPMTFVGYKTN